MSNLVQIDYDAISTENDSSIKFVIESSEGRGGDLCAWIPRSQIEDHDEEARQFWIPEWLAIDRGLV